jgi:oligoendopeptidase F
VEKGGEEIQLTQSNFGKLMKKRDREFRKNVYNRFYDTFNHYTNTIGTTFGKNVRSNVKMANIRNYDSARHAALKSSNIPTEVYDNLVETVEDNLDVLHRHVELKKKALDVDKLEMWDVYMPITESDEPEISYEEAQEYILKALQPLGGEYIEKVGEVFDKRWIDVYENKGKRSGAYSGGSYDTPPYILMNYQDDVSSMYTLAHEMGHSIHSYHTNENQPYVYSDYKIFVAEVASTVNEALLTKYLLENAESDKLKRHALNHSLENFRNTLFRQTLFADFEHRIHQLVENGESITPEKATEIYGNLKEKYYKTAEIDDKVRAEWMRIPHFYYNFYVYQYATGVSAANALSEQILENGSGDYLEFLKTGSSKYPLEALKVAGVNMSGPEPIKQAIEVYRDQLQKAEELVQQ